MSTRYQRRKAKAELRKRIANPSVRKILQSELARGEGTEFYELADDDTGKRLIFNITALRAWAKDNVEIRKAPPDWSRFERLVRSGSVDFDHIMQHTIRHAPEPIIVCRNVNGGDQIVDGSHRYAAMCMAIKMAGLPDDAPVAIEAYVIEPEDWQRFIVPEETAKALGYQSQFPDPLGTD